MHARQRFADRAAVADVGPAYPDAVEKGNDRRGTAGERSQRFPGTVSNRLRARHAALGQMLHQADEEGQVGGAHTLLVERQNELTAGRAQKKIGILDALGYALERHNLAEIVKTKKRFQRVV